MEEKLKEKAPGGSLCRLSALINCVTSVSHSICLAFNLPVYGRRGSIKWSLQAFPGRLTHIVRKGKHRDSRRKGQDDGTAGKARQQAQKTQSRAAPGAWRAATTKSSPSAATRTKELLIHFLP